MNIRIVLLSAIAATSVFANDVPAVNSSLSRWFSVDEAAVASRFVWARGSANETNASQLQHQQAWKARLQLIPDRLSVHTTAASGNHFTAGWNNTGAGMGTAATDIFFKQLYVSARASKSVEIQFGGLDFNRGFSTDMTSYHGQGFLTGQRAVISSPARLFFDQVAFTYGFVGDYDKPGINRRFGRLNQGNYRQFLLAKKFGGRVEVSADFTNHAGVRTLREALIVQPSRVFERVQIDTYQRLDNSAAGLHVSGARKLTGFLSMEGGFLSIDKNYGMLNNDAFFSGNRVYVGPSIKIARGLSFFTLLHRTVATDYAVGNRTFAHAGFRYNVLDALRTSDIK
jgi:hypothetical protein